MQQRTTHPITLATLALVAALLWLAAVPQLAEAATCNVRSKERTLGPTYTTSLTVTRTSCRSGEKLVRSYYRCRVAAGGKKGTCRKRVLGYSCKERRSNVIRTQFDAKVTCRKGSARVVHTYTQFTA